MATSKPFNLPIPIPSLCPVLFPYLRQICVADYCNSCLQTAEWAAGSETSAPNSNLPSHSWREDWAGLVVALVSTVSHLGV